MALPTNFISTVTEIANQSLSKIGEPEANLLTDVATDTTENAKVVRRHLYICIREVQHKFRWRELRTHVVLAAPESDLTDNAEYAWGYRFALPDDYLQPLWDDEADHEIEGRFVYTDVSEDYNFHYVKYSETVSLWETLLQEAIYYTLALKICIPITENYKKYNALLQEYETLVKPELKRVAGYGKKVPNSYKKQSRWSSSRGGGRSYS